ncbi:unnamed protein product [Linum trigynum]|uniref:PGG domain-containing protein n=1 Tax=Linum trigynum TaxID=586398 RepID=A0AAV2GV52_9ROSI
MWSPILHILQVIAAAIGKRKMDFFSNLQRIAIGLVLSTIPGRKPALIRRHENPPDIGLPADPKVMKAMSTGLFLTTLTFGFFVISFLVMVVKKVTQSGKLDCFYGLLAVLGVVNFAVFLVCVVLVGRERG